MARWMARAFDAIEALCHEQGLVRPRDVEALGLSRTWLKFFTGIRYLQKVGPALYALPHKEFPRIARVAARAPAGVVCLLSALHFHQLLDDEPTCVWLAIGPKSRKPTTTGEPLRIVRSTVPALPGDIEEHRIRGVPVRVFGVARTLVDCFRHRGQLGLEVAMSALRRAIESRTCSSLDVWRRARASSVRRLVAGCLEEILLQSPDAKETTEGTPGHAGPPQPLAPAERPVPETHAAPPNLPRRDSMLQLWGLGSSPFW